jgi:uncharacterized membrane protein
MPDLSLLDRAILLTHVLAGVTALVMAPLALLARKGGPAHRRWGTLYFWAMGALFASSLAVLTYRPNAFLLCIAVLAFYYGLLGAGHRLRRAARQAGAGEPAGLPPAGGGPELVVVRPHGPHAHLVHSGLDRLSGPERRPAPGAGGGLAGVGPARAARRAGHRLLGQHLPAKVRPGAAGALQKAERR